MLPSAAAPTDVTGNPSGGAAVASAAVPAVLPSAVVQSAAAGPVAGQPLFCDACEKEFTHDRGLQQHLKSHVQCDQWYGDQPTTRAFDDHRWQPPPVTTTPVTTTL